VASYSVTLREYATGPAAWEGWLVDDDTEQRRAERAAQADYHVAAQQRREAAESAKAQVLVDRFVERATAAGLPTEELTASPWSGRGRYRTGVTGWYLKRNRSIGVSTDGGYYVLIVPPERFGRWRGVSLQPTPPPLQVGKGGRDGDSVALDLLLDLRLAWDDEAP
jgi:hypothetical protein